ncbi:hypothetical protein [Lysinibacillus sp. JNUCC 51]|uniref:hypothetical protein n=1 Tax=Lysinibacillus sp. JNUCC-51 TaxID=2792479 RepID=UPI0019385C5B|nr:hypothetical protein JNUCC51_01865 [Lysinibacillus sp. JNUCC-51]
MKKSFNFILSLVLIISMFSFSGLNVFATENVESPIQTKNIEGEYTFEDIMSLEKYVSVNEGLFNLDTTRAVKDGVSLELLEGQQRYFDSLNLEINEGKLKADENLEITNLDSNPDTFLPNKGIYLFANCNGVTTSPTVHWWGKSRKFNSCDANKFAADLASVGAGAAGAGILAIWFPGMGWASIISAAYCALYSSRVTANNAYNTGVIVDMTWAMVYDIEPQ